MNAEQERTVALGLEALRFVAAGWRNDQIAGELGITEQSVSRRLGQLYKLLRVKTAAHAVVVAAMDRLLSKADLRAAYEDRREGS